MVWRFRPPAITLNCGHVSVSSVQSVFCQRSAHMTMTPQTEWEWAVVVVSLSWLAISTTKLGIHPNLLSGMPQRQNSALQLLMIWWQELNAEANEDSHDSKQTSHWSTARWQGRAFSPVRIGTYKRKEWEPIQSEQMLCPIHQNHRKWYYWLQFVGRPQQFRHIPSSRRCCPAD